MVEGLGMISALSFSSFFPSITSLGGASYSFQLSSAGGEVISTFAFHTVMGSRRATVRILWMDGCMGYGNWDIPGVFGDWYRQEALYSYIGLGS